MARLPADVPRHPRVLRTRVRWAGEVLRDLELVSGSTLDLGDHPPRAILRLINSIESDQPEGLDFLDEVLTAFVNELGVDLDSYPTLQNARDTFFSKAHDRLTDATANLPTSTEFLRRVFRQPAGVVVSTCHGSKGAEYETVICFGLLKGFLPHWDVVIHGTAAAAHDQAARLLYVICSRAKTNLHLIAEGGRKTRRGAPYETTPLLDTYRYSFDLPP